MADYIAPIRRLIEQFRRLPGVGEKTAARYAFATLKLSGEEAEQFADAIRGVKRDVYACPICCGLSGSPERCDICADATRDHGTVCVVEDQQDVLAMEKVRGYRGVYHVLGGALSPLDRVTPDDLHVRELLQRVADGAIREVIVATNPTPCGDTTAAYLARVLAPYGVTVSRLAYGIPVGGDIEYADEVTLMRAMEGRTSYHDR